MKKVVMVDDDITNLIIAKNALIDKYDVFTVPSGKKLFRLLERVIPDLILLDVEMPDMDGYEVIKALKSSKNTEDIPVIFLTGHIDPESEIKGFDMGACDYISKPFSKQILLKRVEVQLLIEKQKRDLKAELQNAILKTVADLIECRDDITGGHIERTQKYLRLLISALMRKGVYTDELVLWDIDQFVMSSQLHDVGKISIKDYILMKPDKLTHEEFEEMKQHAVYGEEIIKRIGGGTTENAFLEHARIMAGTHHEKWNGQGYPYALKGEEIPLQGRLMALVDVYDALTNERPYKRAFSHEDSVEIIKTARATHFDPEIVDVFLETENSWRIANG